MPPTLCRTIPPRHSSYPPAASGARPSLGLTDELAATCRKVVGLDLNEVNPGAASDDEDAWDAIVGARLLYRLIATALATRD
jgi:arginase family enzyme